MYIFFGERSKRRSPIGNDIIEKIGCRRWETTISINTAVF